MNVATLNASVTGVAPQPHATASNSSAGADGASSVAALAGPALEPAAVTSEQLEQARQAANKFIEQHASNLEFQMDAQSGRTIMRLIDKETGSVLRQLPSEEMLAIARALDKLKGLVIQLEA